MIAASSVVLSLYTYRKPHWTDTLKHYIQYEAEELVGCMNEILRLHKDATSQAASLTSVVEKYSKRKYLKVATSTQLEATLPPLFTQ